MALGGAPIGWDENTPADSESAALGDDRIRSIKTSVRQGLDSEHVWGSSGGTVGAHRRGSALPFVGLQSAVSSADTDGRMMWASDTSRLFHAGASGKNYIGGAGALSVGSVPSGTPATHHWVEEFGDSITTQNGMKLITIPNSGYSGRPFVYVTGIHPDTGTVGEANTAVQAKLITATQFHVVAGAFDGLSLSSVYSFMWRSVGTRVL
jgi:hypothetical protein